MYGKANLTDDRGKTTGACKVKAKFSPIKDGIAYLTDMTAFAGSVATADRLVRVMYKKAGVPLIQCIKMITENPAKTMGLSKRGAIKDGYFADLVFFDDDINIKKVIIEGKEFK